MRRCSNDVPARRCAPNGTQRRYGPNKAVGRLRPAEAARIELRRWDRNSGCPWLAVVLLTLLILTEPNCYRDDGNHRAFRSKCFAYDHVEIVTPEQLYAQKLGEYVNDEHTTRRCRYPADHDPTSAASRRRQPSNRTTHGKSRFVWGGEVARGLSLNPQPPPS